MAEKRNVMATPRLFGLVVVLGLIAAIAIGGCSGSMGSDEVDPLSIPVFGTGDQPVLSIGVLSGDTAFEFESIQDVVPLSDGRLLLADAGDRRRHLFDATGNALGTIGSGGPGPMEFRSLNSVYVGAGDTLNALDPSARTVMRFTAAGEWIGSVPDSEVWGDSIYTMDVWPVSRFVVRGAESRAVRDRVDATLRGVPLPHGATLSRMALVGDDGEVWVRERWSGLAAPSRWLVLGANGSALRWVDLPAGFEPQTVVEDRVYGRSVGEFDVERAQVWRTVDSQQRANVPLWFSNPISIPDSTVVDNDQLMADVRMSIRGFAMGQEMHYASNMSYSESVDALDLERAEIADSLRVDILYGNSQGWAMIAAHPQSPTICTLAYGRGAPAGWMGGRTSCGNQP